MAQHTESIGRYAGWLTLSEVFLGSTLHSLHIPFSGTFLTLNQIFLLTYASCRGGKKAFSIDPFLISCVAALLKSLSPSGKKITPMIAIAMQGFLFNLGTLLFANRWPGLLLGAILASAWGTFQSLIIYYAIFGQSLIKTVEGVSQEFSTYVALPENSLYYGFAAFLLAKALAAVLIVLATPLLSPERVSAYFGKVTSKKSSTQTIDKTPLSLALRDLTKPTFLFALSSITLFDLWKEENLMALPLEVAKPLLIAFLCFYALRKFPLKKITSNRLAQSGSRFAQAFRSAVDEIEKVQ